MTTNNAIDSNQTLGTASNVIFSTQTITGGYNQTSVTTTTTLTSAAYGKQMLCTGSSAYAVTLPAVASNIYIDFNVQTTSNALVTITPASGNIQGQSVFILGTGESCRVWCDGTNWWIENLTLLPLYAAVYQTTGQTVATATTSVIALDTKSLDVGGFFNTTTHKYTPLYPGTYLVTGSVSYTTGLSTAIIQINVALNGTTVATSVFAGSAVECPTPNIQYLITCNGSTDYITLTTYQNSGSNATTTGANGQTIATFNRLSNI